LYRVVARPIDAESGPHHSFTVIDNFDTELSGDQRLDLDMTSAPMVQGSAILGDQRPLGGATVQALPLHCAPTPDAGNAPADSPSCMPGEEQTISSADGGWSLMLTPGSYALRVEPETGARVPWFWQRMDVPVDAGLTLTAPVPVYRTARIVDMGGIPLARAIVRVFSMPSSGPAIEVGRAITDADGRFELYLDPSVE
jgi:hypothetical protein